jgi:N-acetylglucosamine-6-phosphate deacetylase
MTKFQIGGGRVLVGDELQSAAVTINGNMIGSVTAANVRNDIDATDLIVSPGFVDLQINGGFGIDLLTDPTGMWELGAQLLRTGVTAFLPTIITSPRLVSQAAIEALRLRPESYRGAEPLGLHFEGPMLNPDRHGAHPVEHLVAPQLSVIDNWSPENGVTMVTIAPELPGAMPVIAELINRGVVVAAGHTNATSAEALAAVEAGVSAVTHLFNAMAPLVHRQPNLVGVTLTEPNLVAGLIVDGVHVDPIVVAAAWNAKGPSGIALVTDAVAAMGQPPGDYQFAGRQSTAGESGVRNSDGTLAGSALMMDQAVRNLVEFTGCDIPEALLAASRTPAQLVEDHKRGRIKPDANADLVLLDEDLHVQMTIRGGRIAHIAEGAHDRVAPHLKDTE